MRDLEKQRRHPERDGIGKRKDREDFQCKPVVSLKILLMIYVHAKLSVCVCVCEYKRESE